MKAKEQEKLISLNLQNQMQADKEGSSDKLKEGKKDSEGGSQSPDRLQGMRDSMMSDMNSSQLTSKQASMIKSPEQKAVKKKTVKGKKK